MNIVTMFYNQLKYIVKNILSFVVRNVANTEKRTALYKILYKVPKPSKITFGKTIHIQYPQYFYTGNYCLYGDNFKITGNGKVSIDNYVYFSPDVNLVTSSHNTNNMEGITKDIRIEKLCWIGTNVTILPGVTIGEGSIIGACTVVAKDIPPYSIVIGNPGIVIKERKLIFPYKLPMNYGYLNENFEVVNNVHL
jgi:acetyltransferase-like isoleucine patch superfamily enzyme